MINKNLNIKYFATNLSVVLGLVLMWRGVWYVLDYIDVVFFGGSHTFSAILGILLGLIILFVPDGDLKEISKL
jgi:presenilin-like A22 family membrane protease